MYLSFKDLCLCILKSLILTAIFVGAFALGAFDYKLGIGYCSIMNIPKDLALTIVSPGMAIEVGILLYVFEMVGLFFLIRSLRNIKLFDNFCNFLSLEYY